MLANFVSIFIPEIHCQYVFLDLSGVSRTNIDKLGNEKTLCFPKISCIGLRFGFQLHKDLVLELTGKPSSWSEHICWEAFGILVRIHLSGQRLRQGLPSTSLIC